VLLCHSSCVCFKNKFDRGNWVIGFFWAMLWFLSLEEGNVEGGRGVCWHWLRHFIFKLRFYSLIFFVFTESIMGIALMQW